jgi:hypothetical protein
VGVGAANWLGKVEQLLLILTLDNILSYQSVSIISGMHY